MTLRDADLDRMLRLPLFAGGAREAVAALASEARLHRFPAGAMLLGEGERVDFAYVLLDGAVELEASSQDDATLITALRPVSIFMLADAVLGTAALASVRVGQRAQILMLPAEAVRAAARRDAGFGFAVARELAGEHARLSAELKNQRLRDGAERLANYLIGESAEQGGAERFTLPLERRRLAALIGVAPDTFARALCALAGHGVRVSGREVTIVGRAKLERLAKPDLPPPPAVRVAALAGAGRRKVGVG